MLLQPDLSDLLDRQRLSFRFRLYDWVLWRIATSDMTDVKLDGDFELD